MKIKDPTDIFGGVAQLVRASACHAEGRRFEPGRSRKITLKVLLVSAFCYSVHISSIANGKMKMITLSLGD